MAELYQQPNEDIKPEQPTEDEWPSDAEIFCSPNQQKDADKSSSTDEMHSTSVAPSSTNVDISKSLGQSEGEGSPNAVLTGGQETFNGQGQEEQPQGTGTSVEAGRNEAAASADEVEFCHIRNNL
jgi:hypothetical protein